LTVKKCLSQTKRLILHKDVVRKLTTDQLSLVNGGGGPSHDDPGGMSTCPPCVIT
jgi:hypothetical protein